MKHTSLNWEINHVSIRLFTLTSPFSHDTKISLKRLKNAIYCCTIQKIVSGKTDITNSLSPTFALNCFSNNGDGPHWVIHFLAQSPKNPGDSFTWQLARISDIDWLWSGAWDRWTLGAQGSIRLKRLREEAECQTSWIELDQVNLLYRTQKWQPGSQFMGLCVALAYFPFLSKLVKCIMMGWGWKGPCSGATCALLLMN